MTAGALASRRMYLGAFGSATGAPAAAAAAGAPLEAAGAAPATVTAPFMPASAWPGIEHRNVRPAAGTVTMPVAVWPASAATLVPSEKVRSWAVEPVLWKVTLNMPAAGTVTADGLKPRSNASIEIWSVAAAGAGAAALGALVAGTAAADPAGAGGGNVQCADVAVAHPAREMPRMTIRKAEGRTWRIAGTSKPILNWCEFTLASASLSMGRMAPSIEGIHAPNHRAGAGQGQSGQPLPTLPVAEATGPRDRSNLSFDRLTAVALARNDFSSAADPGRAQQEDPDVARSSRTESDLHRLRSHPHLPGGGFPGGDRRSPPASPGDALAREGDRRGRVAGRASWRRSRSSCGTGPTTTTSGGSRRG